MSWKKAENEVKKIAKDLPIYWGSGYPVEMPHVVASAKDAWSSEGMGYNVFVYPEGDSGGYKYYSVDLNDFDSIDD